jgi:hypothetical protein
LRFAIYDRRFSFSVATPIATRCHLNETIRPDKISPFCPSSNYVAVTKKQDNCFERNLQGTAVDFISNFKNGKQTFLANPVPGWLLDRNR